MAETTATARQQAVEADKVEPFCLETEEAVVVIHGTFASRADWIQPGSQFLKRLGCLMGERTIRTFPWSGVNSHAARVEAGRELAQFVGRLCSTEGVQRVWCVTHSHGGNVALYALRDAQFVARLAGIVFLGTPFLHVHRRKLEEFCEPFASVLFVLLVILVFIVLVILGLAGFFYLGDLGYFDTTDTNTEAFTVIWFFISLGAGIWSPGHLVEYTKRKLKKFLTGKQDEILGLLAQPSPACPTYIATVQRDEAAFVLNTVDEIAAVPWIAWGIAARIIGLTLFLYGLLVFYGGIIFYAPAFTGLSAINHIVVGVLLLLILAPLFATPFVAALRGAPFAFGGEGFVAASTVRIRPSRVPPWDKNNQTCSVQYPPNKSIRGYRHCFFYQDEHVIDAVAAWIRLNGQNTGCPVLGRAPEARAAVPAFMARWFMPVAVSVVMIASFSWSTLGDLRELNKVKFDFAPDVSSIRDGAAPVLEIDRTLKEAKYDPTSLYGPTPFSHRVITDEAFDIALGVPPGAICVVEGEATFSDWFMGLKLYVYEPRRLSEVAEREPLDRSRSVTVGDQRFSDDNQREIWRWDANGGKEVYFRRRFRNELPGPTARVALRARNESSSPERVMVRMYAHCS